MNSDIGHLPLELERQLHRKKRPGRRKLLPMIDPEMNCLNYFMPFDVFGVSTVGGSGGQDGLPVARQTVCSDGF